MTKYKLHRRKSATGVKYTEFRNTNVKRSLYEVLLMVSVVTVTPVTVCSMHDAK